MTTNSDKFADLGISEPDVVLAKGDLAIRIQRLAEHRSFTPDEAAALLRVPASELMALFEGRLATCSLDQLLRMLTWLGDDVEITIRPRLHRTKRGALRVLQAAAVERPDDFDPVRTDPRRRFSSASPGTRIRPNASDERTATGVPTTVVAANDTRLFDRHAIEKMTSLDITTIYRKMKAGAFPQPVRIGRRRVAWRESDIAAWHAGLKIGTLP